MKKCQKHCCPKPAVCKCRVIRAARKPIVWIIGGSGSGKNTQSTKIFDKYAFDVIHVGSIFRAEVDSGSAVGLELEKYISNGQLVPDEQVLNTLEPLMRQKLKKTNGYVVVSFPKTIPQSTLFETYIGTVNLILHLDCTEETMIGRITQRAEAAGVNSRREDNEHTVRGRIEKFNDMFGQISEKYGDRIRKIDAEQPIEEVFGSIVSLIDQMLIDKENEPAIDEDTTAGCC